MSKVKVGIIGATGYVGVELIRLLNSHPQVELTAIGSNSFVDKSITEVYPSVGITNDMKCIKNEDVIKECDFIFTALPHGVSEKFVLQVVKEGKKVVDLGADFRLKDEKLFNKWYNVSFIDKNLHEQAVYGLCEHYKDEIKNAQVIANPGCYVTSISLPLMPLLKAKLIKKENIIADSKSGVTGAGRGLTLLSHYPEINENMVPYKIGNHRHTPEIEQNLSDAAGEPVEIIFTPILSPMNRGILSTIYCDKPFVDILPLGQVATVKHVRLSNKCAISIHENKSKIIICSAIDNMVKGSAGQAIQNMNLMLGFDECEGLSTMATAF